MVLSIAIPIAGLLGYYIFIQSPYGDEVTLLDGLNATNEDKIQLEKNIKEMVKGYPMEEMVPYIIQKDTKVAAFLVSIAKKESNWGKRVPILNGQDCYNYWGYRGIRDRMGTGGHTCFDSPEDAVNTVARRLQDLVQSDVDTPQEMVIWKCGSACDKDSQVAVKKWISDVNIYFQKIMGQKEPQEPNPDNV